MTPTATLDPTLARRLRQSVTGRMILPGEDDYDRARAVFLGDVDRRPAAIVRASNTADVAAVVRLARESGLELAVRSGGHSGAGHGTTEGGIVLDLAAMKGLDVDVAAGAPGPRRASRPARSRRRCRARPGGPVRRHRLGGDRRDHARAAASATSSASTG